MIHNPFIVVCTLLVVAINIIPSLYSIWINQSCREQDDADEHFILSQAWNEAGGTVERRSLMRPIQPPAQPRFKF